MRGFFNLDIWLPPIDTFYFGYLLDSGLSTTTNSLSSTFLLQISWCAEDYFCDMTQFSSTFNCQTVGPLTLEYFDTQRSWWSTRWPDAVAATYGWIISSPPACSIASLCWYIVFDMSKTWWWHALMTNISNLFLFIQRKWFQKSCVLLWCIFTNLICAAMFISETKDFLLEIPPNQPHWSLSLLVLS